MLLVHGGNRPDGAGRTPARFPAERVDAVEAALGRVVDALRPSGIVTAGAAGADLLVLAVARRLGVPMHLVVPIEESAFIRQSVADAGPTWPARSRLKRAAAWSLDSKTKEVLRWMGTARAPVAGSGAAPACRASVSKPGSE